MGKPTTTSTSASVAPAAGTGPAPAARTAPASGAGTAPVSVTVRIPGPLRALADGADEIMVAARSVGAVLDALLSDHPGLRRHLRTERGSLREHVNIFLNEDDIRFLDGTDTTVASGDTVTIVPSIAGG